MFLDTTYTNGVIAVKEKSLLKEKIFRLCELNVGEAFRILLESGFGGFATENLHEYEKLLDAETRMLDDFIRIYAPSKAELVYFLLPRDFHNAKALIKAKLLGESAEKMLAPNGIIEIELLKNCIHNGVYKGIEEYPELVSACKEGEILLQEQYSGMKLGTIFERYLYQALNVNVKKNRSLRKLLGAKADMTNILISFRSVDEKNAEEQYVSGGKFTPKQLLMLRNEDLDKVLAQFDGEWKTFIRLCLDAREKGLPYIQAEKYKDRYEESCLEGRKYDLVKDEPFLYYVYRKKTEISNVRIVMACLLAGIDETQIKNRLRK